MIDLGFAKFNGSFLEDGDGSLIAKGGLPKCWNFQVAHRKKRKVAADCSSVYHLISIGFLSVAMCLFRADFGKLSRWMKLMKFARIGNSCRRSALDFSRRRWINILTECSLKAKIPA